MIFIFSTPHLILYFLDKIQSTHLDLDGLIFIKNVAINIITTILNMRAPGLSLHKAPLFAWAMLSQSVIIILCIPVLAGANI